MRLMNDSIRKSRAHCLPIPLRSSVIETKKQFQKIIQIIERDKLLKYMLKSKNKERSFPMEFVLEILRLLI